MIHHQHYDDPIIVTKLLDLFWTIFRDRVGEFLLQLTSSSPFRFVFFAVFRSIPPFTTPSASRNPNQ